MRRVIAIARVSIRTGIRSRGMLAVAALLAVALPGLLMMMRDDGTAGGFVRMAIHYPSALVFALIAIIAVWSGSAAVAEEISSRTVQLITTKPVSTLELWAGKWLGLMVLCTALLIAGKAATYGFIMSRMSAWQETRPREYEIARQRIEARRALPASDRTTDPVVVSSGAAVEWRFHIEDQHPEALAYRMHGTTISQHRNDGEWTMYTRQGQELFRMAGSSPISAWNTIFLKPEPAFAGEDIVLRYLNRDPSGAPVVFTGDGMPLLLVPAASFQENFLRMAVIDWCRLAFIAAIGVTAGSLLSLPVAGLVAFFVLILIQVAPLLPSLVRQIDQPAYHDHGEEHAEATEMSAFARINRIIVGATAVVMQPLVMESAAGDVADGRIIANGTLRKALAHGLLMPAGIGILCALLLKRRELAMPGN